MMTTSDLTHFQNSRNAFVPHEAELLTFLFKIVCLGISNLVFSSLVPNVFILLALKKVGRRLKTFSSQSLGKLQAARRLLTKLTRDESNRQIKKEEIGRFLSSSNTS